MWFYTTNVQTWSVQMNEWPVLTAAVLNLITDRVWRSSDGSAFTPNDDGFDGVMSIFFDEDAGCVYAVDREGNLYRMHSKDAFQTLKDRRIMIVQVFWIQTSQTKTKLVEIAEDVT